MALTQQDIEQIAALLAPLVVTEVRKSHHDFWIDPERHYNDHKIWGSVPPDDVYELKQLVQLFKVTKSLWFKAFIGAAIVGAAVLGGFGVFIK
jgi:hypothetical protein